MTEPYPSGPSRSHIVVPRTRGSQAPGEQPESNDPITFDPVFVGPEQCRGCDPGLTVVIDGQVFVADLQGCDDENCYYDFPTGVA
jgi:hypothetical protein